MGGGCPRAALSQGWREGEGGRGGEADEAGLRAAVPAVGEHRGGTGPGEHPWVTEEAVLGAGCTHTPPTGLPFLGGCWHTPSRLCCQIWLHRQQEPRGSPPQPRAPVRRADRAVRVPGMPCVAPQTPGPGPSVSVDEAWQAGALRQQGAGCGGVVCGSRGSLLPLVRPPAMPLGSELPPVAWGTQDVPVVMSGDGWPGTGHCPISSPCGR